MNIENTKAQMRKGILELCILSTIDKKPKYSSEILEGLKESKLLVVEGTLYPLLTRLKKMRNCSNIAGKSPMLVPLENTLV